MDEDYAPVASPDEDEEERKRRDTDYPPRDRDYPPVTLQPGPQSGPELPAPLGQNSAEEPAPSPDLGLAVSPNKTQQVGGLTDSSLAVKPTTPARSRLQALTDQGAPPVQPLHGWKKALDIAGQIAAPRIEQSLRYRPQQDYARNLQQAEGDLSAESAPGKADTEQQQKEAATEHTKAQTEDLKNKSTDEWSVVPGMIGKDGQAIQQNKTTGEIRYSPVTAQALKEPTASKDDKDIADYIKAHNLQDTPQNREKARDEIARRAPSAHVSVEGAGGSWMPTYDNQGHVTGAWNPKTGEVKGPPKGVQGTTSQGHGLEDKHAAATEKQIAPLQQSINDAQQAHTLAEMGNNGNAEADVDLALSFFKTMRSGGQGIRFTRQEQDLILGARSTGADLQAMAQKVLGSGGKFTPDQRKNIIAVIDLHAKAAQQAMDRIKGGGEQPAEFKAPEGAPEAPKEDGHKLKQGGKVIAVSKGGQWAAP